MKADLHFISNDQFQSFTSQLLGEELPSYLPIEGAGGDGGLDGIEGTTAYQMYFPEQKNRTKAKYIKKIDDDIEKAQATATKHDISFTRWILVVPEDLGTDVVLHLQKKSSIAGFECLYWGATKLTALVNKYPHIRNAFPAIFLPDVKQGVDEIKLGIEELHRNQDSYTDVMTDEEYQRRRQRLVEQGQRDAQQLMARVPAGSAKQMASQAVYTEINKKIQELLDLKQRSDRFYELAKQEINDFFDEIKEKKQSELAGRNMLHSGIAIQDFEKIEKRRVRELERLDLKYGKNKIE